MNVIIITSNDSLYTDIKVILGKKFPQYGTLVCNNKEEFEHIAKKQIPAFTYIDTELADLNLADLFVTVAQRTNRMPIILIGTEAESKKQVPADFKEVNSSNGILKRPFDENSFCETVERVITGSLESETTDYEIVDLNLSECLKVPVLNFYAISTLPYDVFAEVKEDQFSLIANKGFNIKPTTLHKFQLKGIKSFYVKKDEQLKFLEKACKEHIISLESSGVNLKIAMPSQVSATVCLIDYWRGFGITDLSKDLAYKILARVEKVLGKHQDIKDILKYFPLREAGIAHKSLLSCYFSIFIGRKHGFSSDLFKKKVGLACFLHDCLLSNPDLTKVISQGEPLLEMASETEKEDYFSHPNQTALLSRNFSKVSELDLLISKHHEVPDGTGFPSGVNAHHLTHNEALFILSINFSAQVLKFGKKKKSLQTIFDKFDGDYSKGMYKEYLVTLKKELT